MRRIIGKFSGRILSVPHVFVSWFILAILIYQIALAVSAYMFQVMNFADGAYFSYIIAVGAPWELLWSQFPARISVFLTTVWPTQLLHQLLNLTAAQISALYGFIFYSVIFLQYLAITLIGWKDHKHLLVLPALNYLLGVSLGFGFPSEMQLATGFFWLSVFALIGVGKVRYASLLTFPLMLFSHELAIFGAAILFALLFVLNGPSRRLRIGILLYFAALMIFYICLKVFGLSPGGANPIYILDPRRVLNNPSLWAIASAFVLVWLLLRVSPLRLKYSLLISALVSIAVPFLISTESSFLVGRYGSARTLMLAGIMLFSIPLFYALQNRPLPERLAIERCHSVTLLAALFAASVGSNIVFVQQLQENLREVEETVTAARESDAKLVVNYSDLGAAGNETKRAFASLGFGTSWTWPFLAVMVADDYTPRMIVYNDGLGNSLCMREALVHRDGSPVPPDILDATRAHICALPNRAEHVGLMQRWRERLGF